MSGPKPTTEQVREAWIVWSAWKRKPTKGRKAAGHEFDQWLEGVEFNSFRAGNDWHRTLFGEDE